tara:strand:- start:1072 stop:1593 length:522 start_codon:yes stop_codon:yes gene_type:complete
MNRIENIIRSKVSKEDKLAKILKHIFVNVCHIEQTKYFILGSYAIRKHRKINDLDINLDSKEFLKLEKAVINGYGKIEFYNNQIRWIFDITKLYNHLTKSKEKDFSIEAFQKDKKIGYPTRTFSLSNLKRSQGLSKDKFGHQFFSVETLLKWKKKMNREKDKKDIELIKKILN